MIVLFHIYYIAFRVFLVSFSLNVNEAQATLYSRAKNFIALSWGGTWHQVRSEIAYLNHGMLVRHIIDETSPLHRRTPEMLRREDSIFTLSVVSFGQNHCIEI